MLADSAIHFIFACESIKSPPREAPTEQARCHGGKTMRMFNQKQLCSMSQISSQTAGIRSQPLVRYQRIVLHIPHSSPVFPMGYEDWSKGIDEDIVRWTDWFTDWLFNSAAGTDRRIVPVSFPFSRFFCDVERLMDDPLESLGQGIIYTDYGPNHRDISPDRMNDLREKFYIPHQERLKSWLSPSTFLIDCHSFPSDLSDVDICLGFNEDWSRPDDGILESVESVFKEQGYKVGINSPYSNSISPGIPFRYRSLMIEINKGVYMKNDIELAYAKALKVITAISEVYSVILGKRVV